MIHCSVSFRSVSCSVPFGFVRFVPFQVVSFRFISVCFDSLAFISFIFVPVGLFLFRSVPFRPVPPIDGAQANRVVVAFILLGRSQVPPHRTVPQPTAPPTPARRACP